MTRRNGRGCTCGGIAPGYPMHEDFCGRDEDDGDDGYMDDLASHNPPDDEEDAA